MSTDTTPALPSLRDMLEDQFIRRAASTSQQLRDIADTIEREAQRVKRLPTPGTKTAGSVAASIVHSLMWGVANAKVDGVVSAAAEFDEHITGGSGAVG